MKKPLVSAAMGLAVAFATTAAPATPFDAFPTRSLDAVPGAAAEHAATNTLFDPPLTGVSLQDDGLVLDSVLGNTIFAPDGLRDSIDAFEKDPAIFAANDFKLSAGIGDFDGKLGGTGAIKSSADIFKLTTGLERGDNLLAEHSPRKSTPAPETKFEFSVSGNAWAALSRIGGYRDEASLAETETVADCCATDSTLGHTTLLADSKYVDATGTGFDPNATLASTGEVRGVYVTEVGLSLAREFGNGGSAYVLGMTPKYVIADVVDYDMDAGIAGGSGLLIRENAETYRHFNADLGIARNFGNGWRTGLVVKNVFAHEYETARNRAIKLTPQARIDIVREIDW